MASAAASEPGCCSVPGVVIVISVVIGAVGHLCIGDAALAGGAPQIKALVVEVAAAVGAGVDDAGHRPLPSLRMTRSARRSHSASSLCAGHGIHRGSAGGRWLMPHPQSQTSLAGTGGRGGRRIWVTVAVMATAAMAPQMM